MAIHHAPHGLNTSVPIAVKRDFQYYQGRIKKRLSLWQAVALIVSSTIGAGIIGLPYAIAKVGPLLGVLYILGFGLLMMYMNLLIGEIAIKTNQDLQLVGLVKKYLGSWGKYLMMGIMYLTIFGVLTIYIIGAGNGLAALLPGTSFMWSLIFFGGGSIVVFTGMDTLKSVELFLMATIFIVVILLSLASVPALHAPHFTYINFAQMLVPYGVVLFSFHSSTSIPEAHVLVKNKNSDFKKAIIYSSIISIVIYSIFSLVVIGVTGVNTTQVATIGLGNALGKTVHVLGNIFALLAMGTSFLIGAISLRDSIHWDFSIKLKWASLITCIVPLIIFIAGLREFVKAIDIVGGVLVSMELLLMIAVYWKAQHVGQRTHPTEVLAKHAHALLAILLVAFAIGMTYSVIAIF
jgi:amino acid permease